ncbi:MAG: ATP-binding cassette domain-containing protein [Pseudomonadota bacterium]
MVSSILPIALRGATVRKRGRTIVGPIDMQFGSTGTTIVLGPNGAGKTTFLRMLHGLERLSEGVIDWRGPLSIVRERQAFVFQTPIILRRTVTANIAYPLQLSGMATKEARLNAARFAKDVGLGEALQRPAEVLSGGEKQKLALARALVKSPDILFLDEPTANLDGSATREIEAILVAAAGRGTRIVMATHNLGQAARLASDVIFLYRGRVHETGAAPDFFERPATRETETFLKGDILE